MHLSQKDTFHTVAVNRTMLANSWGDISLFKLRFCYYLKHEEKRGTCPGSHVKMSPYAFDSTANQSRPPHSPPQKDVRKPYKRPRLHPP